MAQKNPKIVLLAEDMIGQADAAEEVMAAASVTRDDVLEAYSVMQSDFVPTAAVATKSPDAGFLVGEFTDAEARKLADQPNVEAVVDDEMQYAIGPDYAGGVIEDVHDEDVEDFDEALLELNAEEMAALRDELDPDLAAPAEAPSAEEMELAATLAPSLSEEDIATEHALIEWIEGGPAGLSTLQELEPTKVVPAVRNLYTSLKEQDRQIDQVSDAELESILRSRGGLEVEIAAADVILPSIRMIYANLAWRYTRGAGVRLAVIDTGIARHPDLRIFGGVSYVPGVASWRDDHGHGTHVAGSAAALMNGRGIVGVAPRARLYAVKVLDRRGSGRLSWILNGLLWCYRRRMHVTNLSLGSGFNSHDPRLYNAAYERVGRVLRRRGILSVAAAGNDHRRPVGNPARCPSFMAVSAVDYRRRFASFSSIGPQVEVCAPGVQILSTIPGSYGRKSGTSMASPHVAGTAALVKGRHPTWHGDVIRRRINRTALDLGRPGHDWFFGFGQVNAFRSVL